MININGPGIFCRVCGDRASGKHYGVSSCDGCRGFFKRSIRRNLEYVCKEGGKCIVDVSRRNQCQACRFSKCIKSNMRREAVQHERAPRSGISNSNGAEMLGTFPMMDLYSPHRRVPMHLHHHHAPQQHPSGAFLLPMHMPTINNFSVFDASNLSTTHRDPSKFLPTLQGSGSGSIFESFGNGMFLSAHHQQHHQPSSFFPISSGLHSAPNVSFSLSQEINNSHARLQQTVDPMPSAFTPTKSTFKKDIQQTAVVQLAKEDEVTSSAEEINVCEALTTTPTPSRKHYPATDIHSDREALFESAAKLLFLAVKWAKSMPSFAQIPLGDQTLLLEESWSELFVITAAQHGLAFDDILTTSDQKTHRLLYTIQQLTANRIDTTEAACLKALILFRPECPGLQSMPHVTMLQAQTLNLLLEKCGPNRMGHLLLMLPSVRSVADRQTLQDLLFKKTVGEVAIERLLGDLITQ